MKNITRYSIIIIALIAVTLVVSVCIQTLKSNHAGTDNEVAGEYNPIINPSNFVSVEVVP
ncbi:MAG: hypothetical protein WBA22_10290 [Candidatus Methanofastidiosia archaeon]